MITITQVSQLLAAGASIEQLMAAGASMEMIKAALGAPPPAQAPSFAAAPSGLAAIRAAVDPSDYDSGFMDPILRKMSDDRTYDGRAGTFDGSYVVRITNTEYKVVKKGPLGVIGMSILESNNDRVAPGENKEHAIWCNTDAGASDLKGVVQKMAEAVGPSALRADGAFSDDFYRDFESGGHLSKGTEWRVSVHSHPQKTNTKKSFTDVKFSPIGGAAPAAVTSTPAVVPVDVNALLASMGQAAPAGTAAPAATPGIPPELQQMLAALGK